AVKPPHVDDVPKRLTPCGYLPLYRPHPMNDDYNIYGDMREEQMVNGLAVYYCNGRLVNVNTKVEMFIWAIACDTATNQFVIYDDANRVIVEPIKAGDKFYCRNKRCGPASTLQSDAP
ncbi:hypothetical protein PFISCL1PPCAC_25835, partial [Pristionchus fissidentatus]